MNRALIKWATDFTLPDPAGEVLEQMAIQCGPDGVCRRTVGEIATSTRLPVKDVIKAIQELEASALVSVEFRLRMDLDDDRPCRGTGGSA